MKANLIFIRGKAGFEKKGCPSEVWGENWEQLEHRAYMQMVGLDNEDPRVTGLFEVVALVPGREPIKSTAIFYRGCNRLAITSELSEVL